MDFSILLQIVVVGIAACGVYGLIALDDEASKLEQNADIQEFYLGLTEVGKKSYRDVKHYKRRKRWLT